MKSKGHDLLFNLLIEKNEKACIIDNILKFYLKKLNEIPTNIDKDRPRFL